MRSKALSTRLAQADDNYERLAPIIRELRQKGTSYQGVQDYLNAKKIESPSGKGNPWRKGNLGRLIKRVEAEDAEKAQRDKKP